MTKTFLIFATIIVFVSCNNKTNKESSINPNKDTTQNNFKPKDKIVNNLKIDNIYQFDSLAIVNGCGNVYLQKISKDYRYELIIELKFDSLPKHKQFNIFDFSSCVTITLNQYSKDNSLINGICNDAPVYIKDQKKPTKFIAFDGLITITNIEEKHSPFKVSITTTDLIFQDAHKQTFLLPKEEFKNILVGWYAG